MLKKLQTASPRGLTIHMGYPKSLYPDKPDSNIY